MYLIPWMKDHGFVGVFNPLNEVILDCRPGVASRTTAAPGVGARTGLRDKTNTANAGKTAAGMRMLKFTSRIKILHF